jgi:serine/threonine-protein kinase
MEPITQADPRLGLVLNGRYRITAQLGEGGMGLVYRGERLELGRPVAIKFLHSPYAHSSRFVARFQREARAMSKLSHPYCVSVLDYGVQDAPYIVMDFVTGCTLREVLMDGALPPKRALQIQRQLLAGLAHAHGQGVIHRDIKPGNIMLGEATGLGDHVRIFDFGLAKLHDPELDGEPSMAAIVGTPAYMAPEQARADKVDERADLYAAGIVLFEMLAGQKPFQAGETHEMLAMQRDKAPPRLRELLPELSAELEAVVAKVLEKEPANRFQTAADFTAAIDATPEWQGASAPFSRPAVASGDRGSKPNVDVPSASSAGVERGPQAGDARRSSTSSLLVALSLLLVLAGVGSWQLSAKMPEFPIQLADKLLSAAQPEERQPAPVMRVETDAPAPAVAGQPDPVPSPAEPVPAPAEPVPAPAEPIASPVEPPAEPVPVAVAEPAGAPAPSAPADAGETAELPDAVLAAADEALNDPEEREVRLPAPTGATEPRVNSLADVNALIRKGQLDAAIRGVQQLRRNTPRAPQLPFVLGTLYFDKHWWSDGLAKYREAIALGPGFRQSARIQRDAIRALGEDRTYPRARALLVRDIGRSAITALRRAARTDSSKDVRKRAESVLRQITR